MAPDLVSPVDAPEAYRQLLLGLLGGDDPALVQGGTVARMRELVRDAGAFLRDRPAPGEWSVIECLGHLVDGELVVSTRARWVLAEDEPIIVGYDQDRWVDGLHHRDDDPDELLAVFSALRAANLRLWAATPPDARRRFGVHSERGPESYDLMWHLTAGHDRFHVAQAERALATVRGG